MEPSLTSTLKFFARLSKELSKRFGALEGGPGLVVGALEPASEGGKGPSMFFAVASEEKSRTSESWGTSRKIWAVGARNGAQGVRRRFDTRRVRDSPHYLTGY